MASQDQCKKLFESIYRSNSLISAVLSGPREKEIALKVSIRPLTIKGNLHYQISENQKEKVLHHNHLPPESLHWLTEKFSLYKQIHLSTDSSDYHILIGKKGTISILKKSATKTSLPTAHNRQKKYLLEEGEPIPFLVQLNIMNSDGAVYPSKRDKFRQINRFVEMLKDVLPHLNLQTRLHVIDFGCGKSYLTFALHYFLKLIKGYDVRIIGLDLKKDVVEHCQNLSEELGYQDDLKFIVGDIKDYQTTETVDIVVSLHACDIATDIAIEKAVRWNAKVILSVPCCQHELMPQIKQEGLQPLLTHGILRERFAALATDAARAQLLEVLGYQTQILEFIDLEHTPKNLLIRAIKRNHFSGREEALKTYLLYKKHLSINPFLEGCFRKELFL